MEQTNFENGRYTLSYNFHQDTHGKGTWQVCTFVHTDDGKRFGTPLALLLYLEPDRWSVYLYIVTQPDFEYTRTKHWSCRNYLGELIFRYFRI